MPSKNSYRKKVLVYSIENGEKMKHPNEPALWSMFFLGGMGGWFGSVCGDSPPTVAPFPTVAMASAFTVFLHSTDGACCCSSSHTV